MKPDLHTPPPISESAARVASDRTTWKERIGFAIGTLPFNFGASGINQLAYPIYNLTLGMSPTLIGLALAIVRLWDGFTDPLMGSISDNSRHRWGRRRPFIAVGAVLCAFTFPLIWLVPTGWGGGAAFSYFLATLLLFYTAFTIYGVPYLTLGYEMSPDSNERVRIHAVRAMVSKLTFFIVPWIFAVAQLPIFESTIQGMRALGWLLGGLFLALAVPTVLLTRERTATRAVKQQEKVPLVAGLKLTFQNRAFLFLVVIVLGMLVGTNLVGYLGIYVNSYHVFDGDTVAGAAMHAKAQTVYAVAGMIAVPIVSKCATRFGKLTVLRWCIACGIAGSISKFWFFSDVYPQLQYLSMLMLSPAISGFWVLIDPMKADTADFDEFTSGCRREGTYAAVANWLEKMTLTATMLLSGMLLDLSGFDASLGSGQSESSLLIIRVAFAGVPAALLLVSLYLASRYPLKDSKVSTMRDELEAQRGGCRQA